MVQKLGNALGKLHRGFLIVGAFALFILAGAILLMLPVSQTGRAEVSFIDALFLSVSAVSVTGMGMFNLALDFSIFGQMVILVLMQVGGLGIMTVMALVGISTGRKIRLQERLLIRDSFNLQTPSGTVYLVRRIVFMTLTVEYISGVLLSAYFCMDYGLKGIYMGFWQAVSCFTTAGFSLMQDDASFRALAADPYASTVMILTTLAGAVGFVTISDMAASRRWSRLSLTSKLVLFMEGILVPLALLGFYLLEKDNPATLGGMDTVSQLQSSFFMAVSSRSAGVPGFDLTVLHDSTRLFMMMLMFIGTAPVSTGGGIRTTTLAILFLSVYHWVKGHKEVVVFHKRIDPVNVRKASNVFMVWGVFSFLTIFCVFLFEPKPFAFADVLFESISAFTTVGYSMGLTELLNVPCKLVLMAAMFVGRIGIMTLALSLADRSARRISYPSENVLIG